MDQSEYNITTIQNFLDAYSPEDVKKAVANWAKVRVSGKLKFKEMTRAQGGWTKHDGTYWNIPKGYDWQRHGNTIWIRPSQQIVANEGDCTNKPLPPPPPEKQDLTPVVSDKKCPVCGEATVMEPICRGCKEGLAGFTFRYICMDDMDHVFYVKSVEEV